MDHASKGKQNSSPSFIQKSRIPSPETKKRRPFVNSVRGYGAARSYFHLGGGSRLLGVRLHVNWLLN